MSPLAWNRSELTQLLASVIHEPDAGRDLDEEQLALLAEGRLDALAAPERERVLRAIAADPQSGDLLIELDQLGIRPAASAKAGGAGRRQTSYVLLGLWAAAACLLLGLALWRAADPPAPIAPDGSLRVLGADAGELEYWEQLSHQRRIERAQRDRYRDYALIISTGTGLVLSVGLVLYALRRHPHAPPPEHRERADTG
jgi:hypothetical protein